MRIVYTFTLNKSRHSPQVTGDKVGTFMNKVLTRPPWGVVFSLEKTLKSPAITGLQGCGAPGRN